MQARPDDFLDLPAARAGLAAVADAGLVNELVVRATQLPPVARAAAALPESRFVLDHLGKPEVIARGGAVRPSRLMFGSGWPVCELGASYVEVDLGHHRLDAGRHLRDDSSRYLPAGD